MPYVVASRYGALPESSGVYLMRDVKKNLLYIGKAANLRRRASSYFLRPHDSRMSELVRRIRYIEYRTTDTALEALILESELIKKHEPPFNVREKDGTSFLYIHITNEPFPRVLLIRGKDRRQYTHGVWFGPFVEGGSVREALAILRRIFPWHTHARETVGTFSRACLEYEIGLCPGTCIGAIDIRMYKKTIARLILFLRGGKRTLIARLTRDMRRASDALKFEEAKAMRQQLFALQHIHDTALIKSDTISTLGQKNRIEGYDISNISGTSAVGAMVVFSGTEPNRAAYRKFKIKTVAGSNDTAMLTEIIERRLGNAWPLPSLIIVDGGRGQVHALRRVLTRAHLSIPVVGIAKGPTRKKNEFIGALPRDVAAATVIRIRDEAHRFAITYYRSLHRKAMFKK